MRGTVETQDSELKREMTGCRGKAGERGWNQGVPGMLVQGLTVELVACVVCPGVYGVQEAVAEVPVEAATLLVVPLSAGVGHVGVLHLSSNGSYGW